MSSNKKITFIGAGNMARALAQGLLENDYPAQLITMSNRSHEKLQFFAEQGIHVTQDNKAAVKYADIIILAVKPDQLESVCRQIADAISKRAIIVSVAARVTTDALQKWFGDDCAIVRAMPNTGVAVSAGVTGLFADDEVSEEDQEIVEELFAVMSMVVWLEDESLLATVTALSGSGIAYYFRFMELMQEEAVRLGLPDDVARFMVAETALGAAKLVLESDEDIATLRRHVTSPKGSTEQALAVMDNAGLSDIISEAMQAVVDHVKKV